MKKLFIFLTMLVLGIVSSWADIYSVSLGSQVTDLATLSSDKYYVLKNYGSGRYNCFDDTHNRLEAMFGINYTCVVKLLYSDGKVQIQQVQTGTYYQALAASRVSLGSNAVDFTFNTDGVDAGQFRFASGDYFMNRASGGNEHPTGVSNSMKGDYSRWLIYEVAVTSLVSNGNLYKIDFVSKNGNTKWGLSASAPVSGANTGSTFVAHEYTNTNGDTRWIFVNNDNGNDNGKYLGYKTEDNAFNISKPVHEFTIGYINPGMDNVSSDADCTNKFYITATNRSTSSTDAGCYILNEQSGTNYGTFDTSSAPYLNGKFTSALNFTSVAGSISSDAALAIAKFDALYEVKDYLAYAGNISALFADPSSIEANINAAVSVESAATIATNFMKSPEGKKFYAVNSTATSQFLNIASDKVKATDTNLSANTVMEVEYAGNGKYYLKGVKSTRYAQTPSESADISSTSEKGSAETFYIGNAGSTDNQVYFSNKRSDSGNYGSIHYNSDNTYYVVGWTYSAGASKWLINSVSSEDYEALVADEDITISYTLTDQNGIAFSGTKSGKYGVRPVSLDYKPTDETWSISKVEETNTYSYTATITMPFKVSDNENTYYYNIYTPTGKNSRYVYWYANTSSDTNVGLTEDSNDTEKKPFDSSKADSYKYSWAIYGNPIDGFTFKNRLRGVYVKAPNSTDGRKNTLFDNSGTTFTLSVVSGSSYTKWQVGTVSPTCYLSAWSHTDDILTYNSNGAHAGAYIMFAEAPDFDVMEANLTATCLAYKSYISARTMGDGFGEYNGATYSDMQTAYTNATTVASPTANQLSSWITTLENPATKLNLNMPRAGSFLRIKGNTSGKYVTYGTTSTKYPMGDDAEKSIFYYDGSHLLSYSDGIYWGVSCTSWNWTSIGDTGGEYSFLESNTLGKYFVSMPLGTETRYSYCLLYDDTDKCNRGATNNLKDVTNGRYTWSLEEVTSLPLTLAANSYTSFSAPVAVTIPDGCHAYVATSTPGDSYITMTEVTGNVPANTGLIIGTIGTDATANPTFAIYSGSSKDLVDCSGNMLVANVAASNVDKANNYFFGKVDGNDNYVFAKISGTGTRTLGGHKAYLHYEKGTNARMAIIWEGDDPTGIEGLQNESVEMKDGKYYQNGKVVVVRNGVKYNVAGQIIK